MFLLRPSDAQTHPQSTLTFLATSLATVNAELARLEARCAKADGVCFELLGELFFARPPGKTGERLVKLEKLEVLTKALLAPLFSETSIRASSKQRPPNFDKLNRHMVLHGESYDYGTEVGSLQAVSLLYYLAVTAGRVLERQQLARLKAVDAAVSTPTAPPQSNQFRPSVGCETAPPIFAPGTPGTPI